MEPVILLLSAQLEIEKARYKAQAAFSLNRDMQAQSQVTNAVIDEIERQLRILKGEISIEDVTT
jgi:hypothetical protein